uniref:Ubiquitin recognition factor in ER-associated degradation protein 1 n=1 Tax=Ciona savignyi TaxID=51511 RepID=H2ZHE4_CIOSA
TMFRNIYDNDFGLGPRNNKFSNNYRCYSSSFGALSDQKSRDIQKGGKIIMPPSALDQLSRLNISYPMLFKLVNLSKNRSTHCGVLEFVAEEGVIYLPYWMMQNMLLGEGDLVQLENCTLPVATYARFQPQTMDFHDISNPKAVLENALRNFACLTKSDMIAIQYNSRQYELCVQEVRPENAVCIIECDVSLEFDAPVGYVAPIPQPRKTESDMVIGTPDMKQAIQEYIKETSGFSAFDGTGNRLDGKKKRTRQKKSEIDMSNVQRGVPNYKWRFGQLTFIRNNEPKKQADDADSSSNFEAFTGKGQQLRKKKNKN